MRFKRGQSPPNDELYVRSYFSDNFVIGRGPVDYTTNISGGEGWALCIVLTFRPQGANTNALLGRATDARRTGSLLLLETNRASAIDVKPLITTHRKRMHAPATRHQDIEKISHTLLSSVLKIDAKRNACLLFPPLRLFRCCTPSPKYDWEDATPSAHSS